MSNEIPHIHTKDRRDIEITYIGEADDIIVFNHTPIDRITEDDLDALEYVVASLRERVKDKKLLKLVK